MFTGRLPDPSRSWVTYESDWDLRDLEFYEHIRKIIDPACESIETQTVRGPMDAYGRMGRDTKRPLAQVFHVRIRDLGEMNVQVDVIGKDSKGKEHRNDFSGRMCFQCHVVWFDKLGLKPPELRSPCHPNNNCPVAAAEHVMES